MSVENDRVICNQAKALEGMRERLRSHGRKLTERQHKITQQEAMIALRDEKIAENQRGLRYLAIELKEAQIENLKLRSQVPESYQSELTRKCEEVAKAKQTIVDIQEKLRQIGLEIKIT